MSIESELVKLNINDSSSIPKQSLEENSIENNLISSVQVQKDMKPKYDTISYKSSCYAKNMKFPHSKRKFVPVSSLMNTSTKVVLSERNVEIKDLESKVKFLKTKIKELETENRTLQNVQSRQERELKKFKEGITDIPALLKAHKEEIKAYESAVFSIRKELRDCQKELKLRNESLLKKENHIDKLNVNLKQNEKLCHEYSLEIKELKATKKDLEDENKILISTNENLKKENDDLCKQIKDLNLKLQNLEDNLNKENELNTNLKDELKELKEKYERDLLQISNERNIEGGGNQTLCAEDDVTFKDSDKISSEGCMQIEAEKFQNSYINDAIGQDLYCDKPINKTKDALIHNFKNYQHFCNKQLKDSDARLFEIGLSNIKVLPPLKTPSKKSSTSLISDFGKKTCFSSTADINFTDKLKYTQCDISSQDFHQNYAGADYKIDKCDIYDTVIKKKNNVFDFSLSDGYKGCQNPEFRKVQGSSLASKRTETNCEILSDIFKIHDNIVFQNSKENLKKSIINNNAQDTNFEKEKCSFFEESSKDVTEGWEISVKTEDFGCKPNTDNRTGNFTCRNTFLKEIASEKPITSCHFDELSDQKFSRTLFDLSCWDK